MDDTKEFHHYMLGFALSVVLTIIPFSVVAFHGGALGWWVLVGCAIAQLIVHLRYFLHLSFRGQQKEDLQLVLFTGLILTIMIGGSIWILGSLYDRM